MPIPYGPITTARSFILTTEAITFAAVEKESFENDFIRSLMSKYINYE